MLRPDGGSVQNIMKIIMGLNSKTFNYIQNHKDQLLIDKPIPRFDSLDSGAGLSMLHFMSDCMRVNRPCIFNDLASNWNLTEMLNHEDAQSTKIMEKVLGNDIELHIYTKTNNFEPNIPSRGWSFNTIGQIDEQYDYFLKLW